MQSLLKYSINYMSRNHNFFEMKQIISLWVIFLFLVSILSSCGEKSKAGVNENSVAISNSLSETNGVSSEVNNKLDSIVNVFNDRFKTLEARVAGSQHKISSLEKQEAEAKWNNKWIYFIGGLAVVELIVAMAISIWVLRMRRLNAFEKEIASLKNTVKKLNGVSVKESARFSLSDRQQRFDELDRRLKKLEKERLPNVEVSKSNDFPKSEVKKTAIPEYGYFGTAASGGYFSELMNLKNEDARFTAKITGSEASFTPIMKLDDIKSLDWVERAVEFEGGVLLKNAVGMEVKEDGRAEHISGTDKWKITKKVKIRLNK